MIHGDIEKWRQLQYRSRLKYARKRMDLIKSRPTLLTGQRHTTHLRVGVRSDKDLPVFLFNAQRWFNRYIVFRDGRCVTSSPECSGPLEASHLFNVSTSSYLRFDERCVHAQCQYHNRLHDTDKTLYRKFVTRRYGRDFYQQMKREAAFIKKWTLVELRAIIDKYSHLVYELKEKTL